MNKRKNRIAELFAKLSYEVISANLRTGNNIFLSYSAHVNWYDIDMYVGRWNIDNPKIVIASNKYLTIKNLKESIRKVKAIK